MKASVCMITYNHGPFIAKAIESVLMQETDFDFELLIGEDESQDETRKICLEYAGRYPDIIRLFLRSRADVIYINGHPTGRYNFMETLQEAQGEYLAILEGDDYWTDPYKLQKQVDFMEANRDYAICFHNARIQFEDPAQPSKRYCPPNQRPTSTLKDILNHNFIPTASVLYRWHLMQDLPPWFRHLPMGDWPLHVLLAQYGKIGYLDETMSVYRKHATGAWSSLTLKNIVHNNVQFYAVINKHLHYQMSHAIQGGIQRLLNRTADELILQYEAGYNFAAIENSLVDIFDSWPADFPLSKSVRRISFGLLYAGILFAAARQGDNSTVRKVLPKALFHNPSLARNIGVWSIGLEAFTGSKVASWVRKKRKGLRRRLSAVIGHR